MSAASKTMDILIQSERLADEILVNKQQIVSLDKRRQHIREAIRLIEKGTDRKVWISLGSMLVKMERRKALKLLKDDQICIDAEINKLRSNQKILVSQHRDLERDTPIKGLDLKPLSSKEISAIKTELPHLY